MVRAMTNVGDHDRGLAFDLPNLFNRRRMLTLLAGAGVVTLVGCGSDGNKSASGTTTAAPAATGQTTTAPAADGTCETIPQETAGPYPGDGSNGPDILSESGVVRSDIRSSIGSASGVAEGVPLTINLAVLDNGNSCAAYKGAAVYLWQCDRDALYSMYSRGAENENYLRGVQVADANGKVTFKSIFPAAYSGRYPHIHFEVYPTVAAATSGSGKVATSQLALPEDACKLVYATDGYSSSVQNLARTPLQSDMVFRDSYQQQLATVTGSVSAGFTAELTVPV
jgi:protocatechuate 3,4-dioxygenase beta subunit